MSYNVLIVDDSKSMRSVIKKVLRISGFRSGEILEAENGKEALDLLKGSWVDLILTDVHMPVMDGIEFIRRLRQEETLKDVPVLLVTTESNEERLQEAMALGAKAYLRKPFQPEAIRALLNQILGETDGREPEGCDEGCDF
ncbi:MAG: response regulator [Thermodesulfobacteriota bacterium]|nr:response regulator [Thermodesulfobacteriota bacterium]